MPIQRLVNFDISLFFHYYEPPYMLGGSLVTLGRHLQEAGKGEES